MTEPAFLGDVHFWVGCGAIAAGFTAFIARKGNRIHRMAGAVFVISMTLLAGSGLWLSLIRDILFTVFLSALAFHSFATGWGAAAIERPAGKLITQTSPVISGAIALYAIYGGLKAAAAPGGVLNDLPPAAFYSVAIVGFIIFAYDLAFTMTKTPTEQRRLTRHLWRMGFSFFLATGIFFFGNNHVLPEILRTPIFLSMPVIAVVLWTLYYALRTRYQKNIRYHGYKRPSRAAPETKAAV